jgi:hypothetical protein
MYRTKHNIHKRQILMPLAGFESTIQASEQPQIHVLEPAATKTEVTQTKEISPFIWNFQMMPKNAHCLRIAPQWRF